MRPNPQPLPPSSPQNPQNHQKPVQDNSNSVLLIAALMVGAQFLPKLIGLLSSLVYFDLYGSSMTRIFFDMLYIAVLVMPILLVMKMQHSNLRTVVIIVAGLNILIGLYNSVFYYGGINF